MVKLLRFVEILLGGGEKAESADIEVNGKEFQVLRYNKNDNDFAVLDKQSKKPFLTDRDGAMRIIKNRSQD